MEIEIKGIKKYYTLTFMNYDMYDSLIFFRLFVLRLNLIFQLDFYDIRVITLHETIPTKYKKNAKNIATITRVNAIGVTRCHHDVLADEFLG